jgi:general secretion pathway protein J
MVEVLVSMAIMSMIVVSVWGSVNTTMKGMQINEEVQLRYSIVRNGLARITSELSMAYLSFNRPLSDTRHYTMFEGRDGFDKDEVTFSVFAHLRVRKDADESDQSVVQYFVADDPEDSTRKHLYRRESRRLTGDLPEDLEQYYPAYIVIEDVKEFNLQYWDERAEDWIDEWRTTKSDMHPGRLPQRIKIKLVVLDHEEEVEFGAQAVTMIPERIDLAQGSK